MTNNTPIPISYDALGVGRANSNAFITVFMTRDPTSSDVDYPIQKRWVNTTNSNEWVLQSYIRSSEQLTANWLQLSSGQSIETFIPDSGTSPVVPTVSGQITMHGTNGITIVGGTNQLTFENDGTIATTYTTNSGNAIPSAGVLNVLGTNAANTTGSGNTVTVNAINCSKWIVDPTATVGTHTTIAAALAAASSGQDIFIRPGTYTENLTLKAGVNLVAFSGDGDIPNVTIIGTLTATFAGTCTVANIRLQTNLATILTVSGSNATVVNLINCYLNITNNSAISYTSSSSSSAIYLKGCRGEITTTGIALFTSSGAGFIKFEWCDITNDGGSTTVSTISAGNLYVTWCQLIIQITTSGTSGISSTWSTFGATATNATALTVGGSGTNRSFYDCFLSGTASAISVGSAFTISNALIDCSNVNAITGAGTITYSGISFINTSSLINTSTKVPKNTDTGGISFDGGTNVLNTYTQSTYIPVLAFGGASSGVTYTTQTGKYTKIGNVVYFYANVSLSNKGVSTGTATISIPSTAANDATGGVYAGNLTFTGSIAPLVNTGTSNMQILNYVSAGSATALTDAAFANNTSIIVTGFYFTS